MTAIETSTKATTIKDPARSVDIDSDEAPLPKSHKQADLKKTLKMNKELSKRNTHLTKSVETLKKDKESLLEERQKLKADNKSLEKENKNASATIEAFMSEIEHLKRQLSKGGMAQTLENNFLLKDKVEELERKMVEKDSEISSLQVQLEAVMGNRNTSSSSAGQAIPVDFTHSEDELAISSPLETQENVGLIEASVSLERLLEEQDTSSQLRKENKELKIRILSLEATIQKEAQDAKPKKRSAGFYFKKGRRHSEKTDSSNLKNEARSKSPDVFPSSSEDLRKPPVVVDSANISSPRHSPSPLTVSSAAFSTESEKRTLEAEKHSLETEKHTLETEKHTLEATLRSVLEEKHTCVEENKMLKMELEDAKKELLERTKEMGDLIGKLEDTDALRSTLTVLATENNSLNDQMEAIQKEIDQQQDRNEELQKKLSEVEEQYSSEATQLMDDNQTLKEALQKEKNDGMKQLKGEKQQLKEEIFTRKKFEDENRIITKQYEEEKRLKEELLGENDKSKVLLKEEKERIRKMKEENEKVRKVLSDENNRLRKQLEDLKRKTEQEHSQLKLRSEVRPTNSKAMKTEQQEHSHIKLKSEAKATDSDVRMESKKVETKTQKTSPDTSKKEKEEEETKVPEKPSNKVASTRALFEGKFQTSTFPPRSTSTQKDRMFSLPRNPTQPVIPNQKEPQPQSSAQQQAEHKPVITKAYTVAKFSSSALPKAPSSEPPKVTTTSALKMSSTVAQTSALPTPTTSVGSRVSFVTSSIPRASSTATTPPNYESRSLSGSGVALLSHGQQAPKSLPTTTLSRMNTFASTTVTTTSANTATTVGQHRYSVVSSPRMTKRQDSTGSKISSPKITTTNIEGSRNVHQVKSVDLLDVNSGEIKRASSLQDVSSSKEEGNGSNQEKGKQVVGSSNGVTLRKNARHTQRPVSMVARAETTNLSGLISKLQEKQKGSTWSPVNSSSTTPATQQPTKPQSVSFQKIPQPTYFRYVNFMLLIKTLNLSFT